MGKQAVPGPGQEGPGTVTVTHEPWHGYHASPLPQHLCSPLSPRRHTPNIAITRIAATNATSAPHHAPAAGTPVACPGCPDPVTTISPHLLPCHPTATRGPMPSPPPASPPSPCAATTHSALYPHQPWHHDLAIAPLLSVPLLTYTHHSPVPTGALT